MKHILIIEDNIEIAELERDFLEAADFAVTIAPDGEQGLAALRADGADFALVVLDIMLPGRDGFAICRDIRGQSEVPILIVSAKGEDIDKIRGLGLGADDYLTKPFSPGELVARVQSHIKRYERVRRSGAAEATANAADNSGANSQALTNSGTSNTATDDGIPAPHAKDIVRGALRIDPLGHRVFLAQKELALPNKEYELLTFLAEHPGIVFSKEQLFERVWGSTPSATRRPSWSTSTASAAASNPTRRTRFISRPSGARATASEDERKTLQNDS